VHYTVVAAVAVVGYFLGTFPSAVIVARANGIDITARGSGNPGASNVA
jgi:glycerol-3-phosphate acyltransferase PlsY